MGLLDALKGMFGGSKDQQSESQEEQTGQQPEAGMGAGEPTGEEPQDQEPQGNEESDQSEDRQPGM